MPLLQYPKEIKNPDAAFRFLEKNNLKNKTKKYSKMELQPLAELIESFLSK